MGTTFTGSDSFPAAISGPVATEAITGISVTDGDTLLADRTIWLKNRVVGRSTQIDYAVAKSTVNDTGPADIVDMKAITSWTDVSGVTVASTLAVAASDIVIVSCLAHVRHKRTTAGFLGLRIKLTYSLAGVPTSAVANARRWIGDSAATDLPYVPVELTLVAPIAPTANSTITAQLQAICTAAGGGGDSLFVADPWAMSLRVLRPVAAP